MTLTLSPPIPQIVEALERVAQRAVTVIAVEVVAEVAPATPVETGWARSNYVPSIGSRVDDRIGSRTSVDQGRARALLDAVVARYRLSMGPVFITNNVPYIQRLNAGSSTQAPAMFIEAGIERGLANARRVPLS